MHRHVVGRMFLIGYRESRQNLRWREEPPIQIAEPVQWSEEEVLLPRRRLPHVLQCVQIEHYDIQCIQNK